MILFFDTETTGKAEFRLPPDHPRQPRIVQLGAILIDDARHVAGEINLIVKPDGWEIPKEASDIHGITTEYATRYGFPLDTVIAVFTLLVTRAELLVAHNLDFDSLVVLAAFEQMKAPAIYHADFTTKKQFCTMKATTPICRLPGNYGSFKWPKLQEAHKHFLGREFDGAHDAMADVRACAAVYFAMHPQKENPDEQSDESVSIPTQL